MVERLTLSQVLRKLLNRLCCLEIVLFHPLLARFVRPASLVAPQCHLRLLLLIREPPLLVWATFLTFLNTFWRWTFMTINLSLRH